MSTKNYALLENLEQFEAFVVKIERAQKPFGFDIETGYDGPDKEKCSLNCEDPANKLVGASFSASLEWARYVPVGHDTGPNMDELAFAELWWRLLATGLGVPHNAKFELRHFATFFRRVLWDHPTLGAAVRASNGYFPIRSDTMVELYIEAELQSQALKSATKQKFDHEMAELASLWPGIAKNKEKALRFNVLESRDPAVVAYACEDSLWTLAHHLKTYPLVKDNFLYKVEMSIIPILCAMEDFGVKYDWSAMAITAAEAREFLEELNQEIQAELSALCETPISINLGSPKQIADVLYGKLGMKTTVTTKTGAPSTGAIALTKLSKEYEVVRRILDWKEVRKLIDTYLGKYEGKFSYATDGRTHPNHIINGTITGRFAVADPPYQQTPKKYDYTLKSGRRFVLDFRNFIISPPGYYILGFDYSQIELRVMAGEAQEPSLLQAFRQKEDVHAATAALMLGLPREQVDEESPERAIGKTMNFALLYGMGPKSLGERLGIDKGEALALYDQYFSAYSAIRVWVDRQQSEGKQRGYTKSRMGRRHTIWELQSSDSWIYSKGERLCVNAPIQGGAADYMKVAMVRANGALKKAGLLDRVHLVMNIHDALEFYVEESVSPQEVIDVLLPAVTYSVKDYPPIVADWHVGRKWGSLSKIKLDEDGSIIGDASPDAVGDVVVTEKPQTELDDLDSSESVQGAFRTVVKDYAPDSAGETFEQASQSLGRVRWEPHIDYVGEVYFDAGLPHPRETETGMEGRCIHCGLQRSSLHTQANEMMEDKYDKATREQAHEAAQQGALDDLELGKIIHIRLKEMPEDGQFQNFMKLLDRHRGRNSLVVETPEGRMEIDKGTSLDLNNQGEVSMCFAGAEMFYPVEQVSVEDITTGMEL